MQTSRIHKLRIRQVIQYGIVGLLLGLIYISLVDGFSKFYPVLNGIIVGFLMGSMVGIFEIYFSQTGFQKKPFALKLFLRVVLYMMFITLILLSVVTLSRSVRHGQSFMEALLSKESLDYILYGDFKAAILYSFAASLLGNFVMLMSIRIGRGILIDFFLGVYYKPKVTDRLFVFLQVSNANQVLKNNPIEIYHHFLDKIYSELSLSLLHNKGYVYDYIDNLAIVYWKGTDKILVDCIINFYKEVEHLIKQNEEYFKETYNLVPTLQWAAHGGNVVQAEIGELKTEIAFHGDVLNTASRIAHLAEEKNELFVISRFIYDRLTTSEGIEINSIGEIALRGKLQSIPLYSVTNVTV